MAGCWTGARRSALAGLFVAGAIVRIVLLSTTGLRADMDQFVGWVHHIATLGLGDLYSGTAAGPVTFGPVMAWLWSILAAIQPMFTTVTDAADPLIRVYMKGPAALADLGMAALVVFALRDRPRWALLGAAGILLHPAVIDVSAWWGQYESIFVLSGLAATIAATRGRSGLAAALLAVAILTKPQAVAFIVPFGAWFWMAGYAGAGLRGGLLALARAALIAGLVGLVIWAPFLAAGGPLAYLRNLGFYQNEIFNILSLRAWNPWWILQVLAADGQFVRDDTPILGPLTFRALGYAVTAAFEIAIAASILRDPRGRTLVLGLAASVLVIFTFMTQMHERYAYAALVMLVLLIDERQVRWLWLAVGAVLSLNLFAAIPPTPGIEAVLPVGGALGILGALILTGLTLFVVRLVSGSRAAPRVSA